MPQILVRRVGDANLADAIKSLADRHRDELGFHTRQAVVECLSKREFIVATEGASLTGFIRFHIRKDRTATIYEIVTDPSRRRNGVGRQLLGFLVEEARAAGVRLIRLSCPVELPANSFYEAMGFRRPSPRSRPGKSRPLYEWHLPVFPVRGLTFVASLTNAANDLRHLVRLWEKEGESQRPFERCIITPLFTDSGSLQHARYIHDAWGVEVMFDSGGFFVQQGKVSYDELFPRLLAYYRTNDWGASYVLPDYVPTSRNSDEEVDERVLVTASEGVKFFRRMPEELRSRALGVLQGRTSAHLRYCLDAYRSAGVPQLGFGSFDTGGVNAEINLLTAQAGERLRVLRDLLAEPYLRGEAESLPEFHLFGVSTPAALAEFPSLLATSFDSSGWMRTAGYGNVYLPFRSRRNVTHGASALSCGTGFSAVAFYAACEATRHACPFCRDFGRLQANRYVRMLHNALVFAEMTASLAPAGVEAGRPVVLVEA